MGFIAVDISVVGTVDGEIVHEEISVVRIIVAGNIVVVGLRC